MHLQLSVSVVIPPQRDLIVPATVQVAKTHAGNKELAHNLNQESGIQRCTSEFDNYITIACVTSPVNSLLRTSPHVSHIDRGPEPPGGRPVHHRLHQRREELQELVQAQVVRSERHPPPPLLNRLSESASAIASCAVCTPPSSVGPFSRLILELIEYYSNLLYRLSERRTDNTSAH